MSLYEDRILPVLIDCVCGLPRLRPHREAIVSQARGRVLELGMGSGLNLPHYRAGQVQSVVAVEPAAGMNARAAKRAAGLPFAVEVLALSAEKIPAPDASFDSIVTTFTLCTIPDVIAALHEARRVLKPDGRLLFCEHGAAPDASVRRWQDRLTPWWKPLAGGCHLNRDMPALLQQAGFAIHSLHTGYERGPRPMMYLYEGSAGRG